MPETDERGLRRRLARNFTSVRLNNRRLSDVARPFQNEFALHSALDVHAIRLGTNDDRPNSGYYPPDDDDVHAPDEYRNQRPNDIFYWLEREGQRSLPGTRSDRFVHAIPFGWYFVLRNNDNRVHDVFIGRNRFGVRSSWRPRTFLAVGGGRKLSSKVRVRNRLRTHTDSVISNGHCCERVMRITRSVTQ